MTSTIALVGGGRMGGAMLRGWAELGLGLRISVFEPYPTPELAELIGKSGWLLNPALDGVNTFDLVVLGIKPQAFATICEAAIVPLVSKDTAIMSIMAGLSTTRIGQAAGTDHVLRAMPNTPGQIGKGITAYWCSSRFPKKAEKLAIQLLAPLGGVEKLKAEKQIDAVTAVSGSGPAYVFLLAEAMAAAGEAEGLERSLAERLAWQTVIGAGALMAHSGQSPLELRRAVTSPEGTTAAATDVLTAGGGIITMVRRAVEAAVQRSRQLGK